MNSGAKAQRTPRSRPDLHSAPEPRASGRELGVQRQHGLARTQQQRAPWRGDHKRKGEGSQGPFVAGF